MVYQQACILVENLKSSILFKHFNDFFFVEVKLLCGGGDVNKD